MMGEVNMVVSCKPGASWAASVIHFIFMEYIFVIHCFKIEYY